MRGGCGGCTDLLGAVQYAGVGPCISPRGSSTDQPLSLVGSAAILTRCVCSQRMHLAVYPLPLDAHARRLYRRPGAARCVVALMKHTAIHLTLNTHLTPNTQEAFFAELEQLNSSLVVQRGPPVARPDGGWCWWGSSRLFTLAAAACAAGAVEHMQAACGVPTEFALPGPCASAYLALHHTVTLHALSPPAPSVSASLATHHTTPFMSNQFSFNHGLV